ncbi:hypothetical protein KI387_005973, partial [Taxus chinensis]
NSIESVNNTVASAESHNINSPAREHRGEAPESSGFYFSLLNELKNCGNLAFDKLVREGLLEYFLFDVSCQAKRVREELEAGYDADCDDEEERPTKRRHLTAREYYEHLR